MIHNGCLSTCPYDAAELRRLHAEAGGCNALARRLGRSAGTVHGWLVRAGVRRNARGGNNNPEGYGGWTGKRRQA
mgnify:CR=1 FL=1